MSTIHLTDELISEIQEVLKKHDAQNEDVGVGIQYLSAIIGFLVSNYPVETKAQKQEILKQLFDFAEHVLDQNSGQAQAPASDEAFGIWKPGRDA